MNQNKILRTTRKINNIINKSRINFGRTNLQKNS